MGVSSILGTGALVPAGYGFRNLIINGAMQVAQRGTSASSKTTTGYYTADRWSAGISSLGTWTQSVENDAPTGSGFRKSLKMLCTTADASPAAGDYAAIQQMIEGQNLQVVKKGTSSAEQLTVTFWVKSNVTGTYIFELYDNDNTRQVSASYSINASATWEKKTIVIPADTTGAFDNDNALSLYVIWWLGAGSTFTSGTLNTTWASANNANRTVGQTNVAAATNNYWQITGVQMEVGPVATAYEFKPYETELAQCQRYYWEWISQNNGDIYVASYVPVGGPMTFVVPLPVSMRVRPITATVSGSWNIVNSTTGPTLYDKSINWVILMGTSVVAAQYSSGFYSSSGSSKITVEAEL